MSSNISMRILNNFDQIVGKGVLIMLTSVLLFASHDTDWDLSITVLSAIVGVITGLSIYRDFHEIRVKLWETTGFELLRPDTKVIELTGGFSQFIRISGQESNQLAGTLSRFRETVGDEDDPFIELSELLESALEGDHFRQTLDDLKHALDIKDYVDDPNRSELRPVDLDDENILIAQISENGEKPVEGLVFKVYANITVESRGESVNFRKIVATATLFEISGDMYRLQTENWDSGAKLEVSELKSTLFRRSPALEVETHGLDQTDWDRLEDAYSYLESLYSAGITDATY